MLLGRAFMGMVRRARGGRGTLLGGRGNTTGNGSKDGGAFRLTSSNKKEELSFSFSGAGWLSPFHIGVVDALLERGVITDKTKLAGASGGALVAASTVIGIDPQRQLEAYKKLSSICRTTGFIGRVRNILAASLQESFPEDAHLLCNKRLTIAVMQLWPRLRLSPELLEHFHSRQDLLDSLMTSSHVPFYLDYAAPVTSFRGGLYVDGGLIDLVPPVPDSIKVCVFPGTFLFRDDLHITPALIPHYPFTLPQSLKYAFVAPQEADADLLAKLGYQAAKEWLKEGGPEKAANVIEGMMANNNSSSSNTNEGINSGKRQMTTSA